MHRRPALVLPAALVGGALATGFPVRVGLTRSQAAISLPGDLVVPGATVVADRATLVDAPPQAVWPWLTQIGQDRGGFYSFTALENAVGCGIEDVRELRPEWSGRGVGESVSLAPEVTLEVVVSATADALVLAGGGGKVPGWAGDRRATDFDASWTFALLPETQGRTRVHLRERYRPHTRAAGLTCRAALPVSAVMSMRMLHTLKGLAEAR